MRASGLSYAIIRPTLVFGPEDILVNNIAWGLRHVPVFVPGDGGYEVQLGLFGTPPPSAWRPG